MHAEHVIILNAYISDSSWLGQLTATSNAHVCAAGSQGAYEAPCCCRLRPCAMCASLCMVCLRTYGDRLTATPCNGSTRPCCKPTSDYRCPAAHDHTRLQIINLVLFLVTNSVKVHDFCSFYTNFYAWVNLVMWTCWNSVRSCCQR